MRGKAISRCFLSFLMLIANFLCGFGRCPEFVYMRIAYTGKMMVSTYLDRDVSSVNECLEMCRDDPHCKSVGIKVRTMTCIMYAQRIYAGSPIAESTEMVYYWLLEDKCPTHLGYEEDTISKVCSKFTSLKFSMGDAQTHCEKEGGHLFMADTPAKIHILQRHVTENNGAKYVGGTDEQEQGVWNWLNGVPINRSQFAPGEPSDKSDKEDCIIANENGLNGIPCVLEKYSICEIPTKNAYSPPA